MAVLRVEDLRCRLLDLYPAARKARSLIGHGRCGKQNTVVAHPDCIESR